MVKIVWHVRILSDVERANVMEGERLAKRGGGGRGRERGGGEVGGLGKTQCSTATRLQPTRQSCSFETALQF